MRAWHHTSICLALAVACATSGAPAPASPHPVRTVADPRPWLTVTIPAPPRPGADGGTVELTLRDTALAPSQYAGARIVIGGAPAVLVPLGERAVLPIAVTAAPIALDVDGTRVLAHLRPGDRLAIHTRRDGGWAAVIANRMRENAPAALTRCVRDRAPCPTGAAWTPVHAGDPVCPDADHKCVRAPTIRARASIAARAEVTGASPSGRFDDLDTTVLAPGSPIAVAIDSDRMPRVQLGDASALLVIAPGESYEVWLDVRGQIDSTRTP